MDITTLLLLIAISLILAIFTFIISKSKESHHSEVVAIPVLTLLSLLFTEQNDFNFRLIVTIVLLASYVVFYFLIWLVSKALIKSSKKIIPLNRQTPMTIKLPLNHNFEVDNDFLDDFPANVSSIVHTGENIRLLTNSFQSRFISCRNDTERDIALQAYFMGICYYIAALFDSSTRVHVRILSNEGYKKYTATCEGRREDHSMKSMSFDNQMIMQSFKNKCSLIKTLNLDLHENGSNHKWKNYLMFSLPQIERNGRPVFTMGISVTKKKNELFYFLNYCQIESIVGRYIDDLMQNESCHLGEFIERFYFQ